MQAPDSVQHVGREVMVGDEMEHRPIELEYGADVGAAQPDRTRHNCIEHGLHGDLGTTDHPQDLTGGGLLLQCLCQLTIAGLQLLEQPHVLDGDDGLVGKGLEQGNLPLREEAHLGAAEVDRADSDAPFAQQWNAQDRAEAQAPRVLVPRSPCNPCSIQLWRVRSGCAAPTSAPYSSSMGRCSISSPTITSRPTCWTLSGACIRGHPSVTWCRGVPS